MAHIESANETNETIPYKSLHNQRHRVLGTFFPAPIEWFPLAISLQCFCRLRSSVKSTQNCPFSSINGLPPKVSLRLRILTDRDFTFICSYLLERNLRFFFVISGLVVHFVSAFFSSHHIEVFSKWLYYPFNTTAWKVWLMEPLVGKTFTPPSPFVVLSFAQCRSSFIHFRVIFFYLFFHANKTW